MRFYTLSMKRLQRSSRRARAGGLLAAIGAVFLLSSCIGAPADVAGEPGGAPVDFDGVQSATIQIEAVGAFVSPEEGGFEAAGRGSGFLISASGLAITNNHVVVGAGTIKVWRGGDGTETLGARVLGSSECLDLAVIQLEKGDYPFMDWRKGEIKTATEVYAAGFPLGDPTFTETKGIVSKASTDGQSAWASIGSVIEHDARIREGNSGGPLVDSEGRLVGVNYAGNDELDFNFAIHRDEVLDVIGDLVDGKDVLSLGINGEAITSEDGEGLGVWVNSVASGSVADEAGVEPGDLLTRMEGVSLAVDGTLTQYCDVLRTHGQDATISVELYRPAEEVYYRGQFNGDAVQAVPAIFEPGTESDVPEADYVTVEDDSGVVFVDVPAAWTDLDGTVATDDEGNSYASIMASTDVAGYNNTWTTSGVAVYASTEAVDTVTPEEAMDLVTGNMTNEGCVSNGREPYDDGFYTGFSELWEGCGGAVANIVVGALSYAGDHLVVVTGQAATDADVPALERAVSTFYAAF